MREKDFLLLFSFFKEKNDIYLQLESQRTTMGEAEERLTRLGKKRAITKYLSDSSIFFLNSNTKS